MNQLHQGLELFITKKLLSTMQEMHQVTSKDGKKGKQILPNSKTIKSSKDILIEMYNALGD